MKLYKLRLNKFLYVLKLYKKRKQKQNKTIYNLSLSFIKIFYSPF